MQLTRYERQMQAFSKNNVSFNLNPLFVHLNRLPIRTDLLFDTLPIFHVNVSNKGTFVKFDLDPILARL